jgi:ribose transport system substrate-binding protein
MIRNRYVQAGAAFLGFTLLAGCSGGGHVASSSGKGSPSDGSSQAKTYTVGIAWSALQTPYFAGLKTGVDQASRKVPGLKIVQVQANDDGSTQLDQVSQLLSQKVDLLVINVVDAGTEASAVQQAKSQSVPVFTLDRMIPSAQSEVVTHVGASAEQAGYEEAQLVCHQVGKNAKYLGIWGLPGNQTTRDRVAGVKRGAKDKGCNLQLVSEKYEQGETTEAAAQTMGDWLQRYQKGSVDAVITYADSQAAGALQELHSANRTDMVVTGAANFGPFHDAICKGDKQALGTVDFNTAGQGKTLVETIQKFRSGAKLPAWTQTPEVVVTPQNKATC